MGDIAREAGVHPTTVSRALRNDPRITEKVRFEIQAIAERMGYRVNPLLSALSTLRRQKALSIYQSCLAYVVRRGIVTEHSAGVRAYAQQRGYKVEVFEIGENLSDVRLNQILTTQGIQGVVLGPLPEAHGHFNLDWHRLAIVAIEYSFTDPAVDRVVTDSYGSIRSAVEHCFRLGYTRIGLALDPVVDERNEGLIRAGYYLEVNENQRLKVIPPLIPRKPEEGEIATWISQYELQVIITSNFLLPQIESVLKRFRLSVPEDIGLVNINTSKERNFSGICQDSFSMGGLAARLVIEKMNFNDYGVPKSRVTLHTPFRWIEGETLLDKTDQIGVSLPGKRTKKIRKP